MGAGFQSWAQDGSNVVQIDGDAGVQNLQLRAKHNLTTNAVWESYGDSSSVTPVVSISGIADPVIAIRCPGSAAAVLWMSATQFQVIARGAPGVAVTAYVFGRPVDSGLGLFQVRNAANQIVFDTGLGAMRVRAQYSPTAYGTLGTLAAGRTYAAVVNASMSRTFVQAGPVDYLRFDLRGAVQFATASANRVDYTGVVFDYEHPTPAGSSIPMNQAQVLVLDVTNY